MAKSSSTSPRIYTIILLLCIGSLTAHFFADSLGQLSVLNSYRQDVLDTHGSGPVESAEDLDDGFIVPALALAGGPGALRFTGSGASLYWMSHTLSPLVPPPKPL
jgi:hypothetical protein